MSWMSSPVLDAAASITGGVLSIIVRVNHVRLNQPEDYTVPQRIHGRSNSGRRKGIVPGTKTKKSAATPQPAWSDHLRCFSEHQHRIVNTIRELVEIESPSDNKQAVDRIGAFLARKFEALGGRTRLHRSNDFGDSLQINFGGDAHGKPVLLLGHYDTVYPLGTLANMPCKIDNGRLHGPGVLDMKSGIALMLHAVEALQAWHSKLPRPVTVFLVSDEEIGSHSSRK